MDDALRIYESVRLSIHRHIVEQGYYARVARAGGALERWRGYLDRLVKPGLQHAVDPMVRPTILPMMEGLHTPPWRDPSQIAAAAMLENSFGKIRQELEAVAASRFIHYPSVIVTGGHWSVVPVFVYGEDAGTLLNGQNSFPETTRILLSLPDACPTFPLADVVFSAHMARTHLEGHCSWDPFRLRLHLAIRTAKSCRIRVGNEQREWQRGKVLAFHDACEHETWNDSAETRIVLIVDLWHPDLTMIERRAILACFLKSEIRTLMMGTRAPLAVRPAFESRFAEADRSNSLIAEYWGGQVRRVAAGGST